MQPRPAIHLPWALLGLLLLTPLFWSCADHNDPDGHGSSPRVLLITAHPDDETLFNLGRFKERGWYVAVALVTNGEGGSVVQAIRHDYDPDRDKDILIEAAPGPDAWLTQPPAGPRLRQIASPYQLAEQRRGEFLSGMARHRVSEVFFLSTLEDADFEDSWDNGVINWDQKLLVQRLGKVVRLARPDIIITLNPDETWAHPQHQGLGRIVRALHRDGFFDRPGVPRPALYGLREHGWYFQSLERQVGDLSFDRYEGSSVLETTYADYWWDVTSTYISQSSHPLWFEARAGVGILPGYAETDLIRRLACEDCSGGLNEQFARYPATRPGMNRLPDHPTVYSVR
jgi:LmbE family N-acetylglucosaminyl deacetylase